MKLHEGLKGFYFCNRVMYSNKNIHRAAAATINIPGHSPPPAGSFFSTAAFRDKPIGVRIYVKRTDYNIFWWLEIRGSLSTTKLLSANVQF